MAGLLDNLFGGSGLGGKSPELQQVALDPASQGLLNAGVAHASQGTDAFANEANQGVSARANQLAQPGGGGGMATTGVSNGNLQSIRNAYGTQANQSIKDIQSANGFNANIQKANELNKMAGSLLGQQRAMVSNYQALTQAYNQSEAARAQLVSSISGGIATGIGYAKVGAPAASTDLQLDQASYLTGSASSGFNAGQRSGSLLQGTGGGRDPYNSQNYFNSLMTGSDYSLE